MVTVVGHAATIAVDHRLRRMANDRTHGQQFKARSAHFATSADGIEKYLVRHDVRGVEELKNSCAPLARRCSTSSRRRRTGREVDGIGAVRAASILAAWG